jgi:uncharacterized protein (TIGR00730 family)
MPAINQPPTLPEPAHPQQRDEPLPWQHVKPAAEDPQALQRVQAILNHPNYRQADHDVDFLNLDATRPVRLQIDYLKPELVLQQQGIEHTIVVFGSTRLREPVAAQAEVARLQALVAEDRDNAVLQAKLAVAQRILGKSHYYDVARELGRLIGEAGTCPEDCRVTLMTGGGPGAMEAANRGAFDVGARSIGLNITLPHEQYPNPYVSPDLCFRFHYFGMRKMHFLMRARALVAFPGGYGTFDELFEALTLIQTRKIKPMPIILVGEEYWRGAVDIDYLVAEGVIETEDRDLIGYAESASQVWQGILSWHEANNTPLF